LIYNVINLFGVKYTILMSAEKHPVTLLLNCDENSGIFIQVDKDHINAPMISEFYTQLDDYFNNNHECCPQLIIKRTSHDSFLVILEYYPDDLQEILFRRQITESTAISLCNEARNLNMDIIIQ